MKKLDLLTIITHSLLAFVLGLAGVGCLCTAFDLDVSFGSMLLTCALLAMIPTVLLQLRGGALMLLGLLALCGWRLYRADVVDEFLYLLKILFHCYRNAYGWVMPAFLQDAFAENVTLAICLIGGISTLMVALFLQLRRAFGAVLFAALPLMACLVVTDTVPHAGWLLLLLLGMALILLSQKLRRRDPRQGSRLVALALVPVLLCSLVMFAIFPQENYKPPTEEGGYGYEFFQWMDRLPLLEVDENGEVNLNFNDLPTFPLPTFTMQVPDTIPLPDITITLDPTFSIPSGLVDELKDQIPLGSTGPRNPSDRQMIQISTAFRGNLYLRDRGYDIYDGTSWRNSGLDQDLSISTDYLQPAFSIQLKTNQAYSHYFMPYYVLTGNVSLPGGQMENPREFLLYTLHFSPLRTDWQVLWEANAGHSIGQIDQYWDQTALPTETYDALVPILQQLNIDSDTPVVQAAEWIKNYVSSSATYDLNTGRMPEGTTDFALWFLNESDTGYCVHFATATTVLLRAAGIPARYVEGYLASHTSSPSYVLESQAHAWVEYFVPDLGWVILEPTPSGSGSPVIPDSTTTPTVPDDTTLPPETTVPTQPTEPEGTTEPTEPTTQTPTTVPQETTTVPESSTAPSTTGTVPATGTPMPPAPKVQTKLLATIAAILGVLFMLCLTIAQWQLRLWLTQWYLGRGNTNRRAIKLWQDARRMAKLRRQDAPVVLRDLAWKAAYSPYTITEAELQLFLDYKVRCIAHLKSRPWFLQLVYRLIFAAY